MNIGSCTRLEPTLERALQSRRDAG